MCTVHNGTRMNLVQVCGAYIFKTASVVDVLVLGMSSRSIVSAEPKVAHISGQTVAYLITLLHKRHGLPSQRHHRMRARR